MTISEEPQTYWLNEDAMVVDLEQETIALSLAAGRYFGIKGAMHRLMPELRAGCTRAAMIERLCAIYDVSAEAAAADIDRMLPQLVAAGIVRKEPAG